MINSVINNFMNTTCMNQCMFAQRFYQEKVDTREGGYHCVNIDGPVKILERIYLMSPKTI